MIADEQFSKLIQGDNQFAALYERLRAPLQRLYEQLEAFPRFLAPTGTLRATAGGAPEQSAAAAAGPSGKPSAWASVAGAFGGGSSAGVRSSLLPMLAVLERFREGGSRGKAVGALGIAGAQGRTATSTRAPDLSLFANPQGADNRHEEQEQTRMLRNLLAGQKDLKQAVSQQQPSESVWAR